MRAVGLALVLAAATSCGATPGPRAAGSRGVAGCPPARAVRHTLVRTEGETPRWGIPLGSVVPPLDETTGEPLDETPPVSSVSREEVVALGLEPGPETVWLLRPGVAPCRARITGFSATLVTDGLANLRYDAVTPDCLAPGDERLASAWVSDVEPGTDCTLVVPLEVGRVELATTDDGLTRMPDGIAPVPAPFAAHVPPPDAPWLGVEPSVLAAAPALWALRVAPGRPGLAELWVSHVVDDPPDEPCGWSVANYAGLHVEGGEVVPWPEGADGDTRPRTLAGLLVEGSATRVVLLTDHAWSATYELEGLTLVGGREVQEFVPHEEDGTFRSLGPYCGP